VVVATTRLGQLRSSAVRRLVGGARSAMREWDELLWGHGVAVAVDPAQSETSPEMTSSPMRYVTGAALVSVCDETTGECVFPSFQPVIRVGK
jgi:hypothetical protein